MTRLLLAFIVTDIHDKAQLDVKDLHFSAVYISGKICFNSEVICHNFLQELNQLFSVVHLDGTCLKLMIYVVDALESLSSIFICLDIDTNSRISVPALYCKHLSFTTCNKRKVVVLH